MSHFGDLIQLGTIVKNYSSLHTMYRMGHTDVHTFKLILCSSLIKDSTSVRALKWAQSDETKLQVLYIKQCNSNRTGWQIKFYFNYPHFYEAIEVTTKNSYQLKKQRFQIKPKPTSFEEWHHFADTDLIHTSYATVTIQIDISRSVKESDNTLPNLSNLLIDPIYSDATIESCDGVALKIHRCILALRSDVFKANFIHSSSSTIQSTFEAVVLKELLNFVYSGIKAVKLNSVADRLFVAADFYQLNDLRSFCEYALYKQLAEDNVIDILMLADAHSAADLKNLAMDFLDSNASIVLTKTAWADLNTLEILKPLYESTKAILEHITEAEKEN